MNRTSRAYKPTQLDEIDIRILEVLRDDGRLSVSALAKAVHISRATAYARLERLNATGVLTGYTVSVNPARTGLDITAIILLSARHGPPEEIPLRTLVDKFPEVEYFAYLTGPFDAIAVVRAPNMSILRDVILRKFQQLPGVRSTQTSIVLEETRHLPFVLPTDLTKPTK